jgi:hypothetical protein
VFGTEFIPGEVEGFVRFSVADLLEAGDTGGGALLGKGVEGLFTAYPSGDGQRG